MYTGKNRHNADHFNTLCKVDHYDILKMIGICLIITLLNFKGRP